MKTAVVVCPGRGTYNATELGYLGRHFPKPSLMAQFDGLRTAAGQQTLTALDSAAKFSLGVHGRGDSASGLIYAATLGDYLSLNTEVVRVVAVTGNSMGWYSALACAGALTPQHGFQVANTMGHLMQDALIGGQLVYPWIDDGWHPGLERKAELLALVGDIATRTDHQLTLSIDLGGLLVLAGNEAGLHAFETAVEPVQGRFPLRLGNHAAFHSALQQPVAQKGQALLQAKIFGQPTVPLIDGRGEIWWPGATDHQALWDYTLGHQVVETYDFNAAIRSAAQEFAPDLFIVTGPGNTLGGAVAQSLILAGWRNMASKADFSRRQSESPLLVSMGLDEQRRWVA